MRRLWLPGSLLAALVLLGLAVPPAPAGKSGGSNGGGRSFSAPSGRSYSSGGGGRSFSFSGKSYGSGGGNSSFSPGGRSYSSGGRGSTPSVTPTSGGRTFSSGGTSPRPGGISSSPVPPAVGGRSSPVSVPSSSGKSYGAPRGSKPSPPLSPPGGYTSPSGKSYSSRGPAGSSTSPSAGGRKGPGGFDAAAAAAQQKEESRARFTKGQSPAPTYTDPKGTVRPIDPKDQRIDELRKQLDQERWSNRDLRERQYYRDYYNRPLVVYHDPYSSPFWWWLLDQNLDTRAWWVYHHQQVMDAARYQALLARDAQLEAQLRQLEAQGVVRDPTYTPPGLPPDLMYTDAYVGAAYNPQPPLSATPPVVAPYHSPEVSFWHGVRVLLYAVLVIAVLALIIWLVFFKRWGTTSR
jgi:hypothetical protein